MLQNILLNANPLRVPCIPCQQPGERKQDCRRRNIIYESQCTTCNPKMSSSKRMEETWRIQDSFEAFMLGKVDAVPTNVPRNNGMIPLQKQQTHAS